MINLTTINVPQNQETFNAISNAEQLLMSDDNCVDPLLDTFLNDMIQDPFDNDFPDICFDENIQNQGGRFNDFTQSSSFGNPIQIPDWPIPSTSHSCTCCQTLREFFHINDPHVMKLEVHGRVGTISHAMLERYNTNMPSQKHEYFMFDFCMESLSSVKQFLVQYCDDRKREGYVMLQDPLSNFYNALCIGLDDNNSQDGGISLPQTSSPRGGQMDQEDILKQQEEDGNGSQPTKSCMASQRERVAQLKLRDLVGYFHLPMSKASKEMNLCSSAIKGICRREGLLRWPYRKIKGLESEISKRQKKLSSYDFNERARALTEIQELQQKLANYYEGKFG